MRRWLINGIVASAVVPHRLRLIALALYGVDVTRSTSVGPGCFFGGSEIRIGAQSTVNTGCFIDNVDRVDIGDHVGIGSQVTIITGAHEIGPAGHRAGPLSSGPVTIEDGCWLGARVVVLPGVTIGRGCVVGAGAVVTRDCQPNGVYVGVPARRLRELGSA
jgi:maltose O-acetyltransferase